MENDVAVGVPFDAQSLLPCGAVDDGAEGLALQRDRWRGALDPRPLRATSKRSLCWALMSEPDAQSRGDEQRIDVRADALVLCCRASADAHTTSFRDFVFTSSLSSFLSNFKATFF